MAMWNHGSCCLHPHSRCNHVNGCAIVSKTYYGHFCMKQGGAESRGSETRPLEQLLMKDKCDTRLESSRAFIMPQLTASASSVRV